MEKNKAGNRYSADVRMVFDHESGFDSPSVDEHFDAMKAATRFRFAA
jgi:hypothetical protein